MAHSPKLLQGALAGVCDYYTFGLALRVFGAAAAGWALLFQVLSWFNFYCLVRPYSNSAEAVLATAALYHWAPFFMSTAAAVKETKGNKRGVVPRRGGGGGGGEVSGDGSLRSSSSSSWWQETCALLLAALCIAVRPTSAALWVRTSRRSVLVALLLLALRVSVWAERGCVKRTRFPSLFSAPTAALFFLATFLDSVQPPCSFLAVITLALSCITVHPHTSHPFPLPDSAFLRLFALYTRRRRSWVCFASRSFRSPAGPAT